MRAAIIFASFFFNMLLSNAAAFKLKPIRYENITISENRVVLNRVLFEYDFLLGDISSVEFSSNAKLAGAHLINIAFADTENKKWNLSIESAKFNQSAQLLHSLKLVSETQASVRIDFIAVENVEADKNPNEVLKNAIEEKRDCGIGCSEFININQQEKIESAKLKKIARKTSMLLHAQKIHLAPSEDKLCWAVSAQKAAKYQDFVVLSGIEIGLKGFMVPWLDLRVSTKPCSGFFMVEPNYDEYDGLNLYLPAYFYFNKYNDLRLTPTLGQNFGLAINYRLLYEAQIFNAHLYMRCLSLNDMDHGACLHLTTKQLDDSARWNMNFLITSSRKCTKYWDNKYNKQRREFVPSYIYYSFDNDIGPLDKYAKENINSKRKYNISDTLQIGLIRFESVRDKFNIDQPYDILVPKIMVGGRINFEEFFVRTECDVRAFLFHHQNRFKIYEDVSYAANFLASVGFSKHSDSQMVMLEAAFKISALNKRVRCYPIVLGSIRFQPIVFNIGEAVTMLTPYLDCKYAKRYEAGQLQEKWANTFAHEDVHTVGQTCYESLSSRAPTSMLKLGVLANIESFEVDLGFLKDMNSYYVIAGVQYNHALFSLALKDYIRRWNDHRLAFSALVDLSCCKLNSEYSVLEYQNVVYHRFATNLYVDLTHGFGLNVYALCSVRPELKFAQGGLQMVYTNKCWKVAAGISYGSNALDYHPRWHGVMLSFSVSLNGAQQFLPMINQLSKLKQGVFELGEDAEWKKMKE